MAYTAEDIRMVDKHIAEGERHVIQQTALIERLRSCDLPTDEAQELLELFRATLLRHHEHREIMMHSIGLDDPLG